MSDIAIPDRLKDRPTYKDIVVPFIADATDDAWGTKGGVVNFGKASPTHWADAAENKLCGICGQRLGYWIVFAGGPNSVASRSFLEPGMHEECAAYAAAVCPWMLGGKDYEDAERTLELSPTKEPVKVPDGDPNRLALYFTHSYKIRRQTTKKNGAPRTMVYFYAGQPKRVDWRERAHST